MKTEINLKDLQVMANIALTHMESFEKGLLAHYEDVKCGHIWDMQEEVQAMSIKMLHITRRIETFLHNEKIKKRILEELKDGEA